MANVEFDIFMELMDSPVFVNQYKERYTEQENWYEGDVPDLLIALAYVLKHIEYFPTSGNKAAWVFRTLFGNCTHAYYGAINGIIRHHPEPDVYKEALERELSL